MLRSWPLIILEEANKGKLFLKIQVCNIGMNVYSKYALHKNLLEYPKL